MKNKKVIIISAIIALVAITAIIVGVLYFTTDLFKSNQQLFYKYLSKTKVLDYNFAQSYKNACEKISNTTNISTTNVDVSTSSLNTETGVSDITTLFNIKGNALKNKELNQSYRDFIISSNDNQIATIKLIKDGNTYGIRADNILSKYLSVENTNLKDLCTKFGIQDTTAIPNSIPTNLDEILAIDDASKEYLKENYGTLIYNSINENNFYIILNEDNTEEIGVSLTEQEISNIIKLILETAKNDTNVLNLLVNKIQLLGYTNITIENIQTEIQKYIDQISNTTYSQDKDYLKLSLVKYEKNVIKIKIELNETAQSETYMAVDTDTTVTQDDLIENNSQNTTNSIIELDFAEKNVFKVNVKENGQEVTNSIINYSFDTSNINLSIQTTSIQNENTTSTSKVQYQIANYSTENIQENYVIDISSDNEPSYQVKMVTDTQIKQDVQIEKLTTENSAKLNDMTQEQINQLFVALINRIGQVYGQNLTNLSLE